MASLGTIYFVQMRLGTIYFVQRAIALAREALLETQAARLCITRESLRFALVLSSTDIGIELSGLPRNDLEDVDLLRGLAS